MYICFTRLMPGNLMVHSNACYPLFQALFSCCFSETSRKVKTIERTLTFDGFVMYREDPLTDMYIQKGT